MYRPLLLRGTNKGKYSTVIKPRQLTEGSMYITELMVQDSRNVVGRPVHAGDNFIDLLFV